MHIIHYTLSLPYNNTQATKTMQLNVCHEFFPPRITSIIWDSIWFWEAYSACVVQRTAHFRYLCWMDAINLPILHSGEREVTKFLQCAVFCCYCPSSSLSQWLPAELPHWSPHIIRGLILKPLYQKPTRLHLSLKDQTSRRRVTENCGNCRLCVDVTAAPTSVVLLEMHNETRRI